MIALRIAVASDHGGLPLRDEVADVEALAAALQRQSAAAFDTDFTKLLKSIESKVATLRAA